ncbi:helix-turn-helix domain-containing protein [Chryseobacterium manosquense]|uniref:Helix-turn-helix domain-containing protein n=1 Tax=Chryseobacterium manosquense TaxID=2754694 RepID=A0A7H1DXR3_9FLAO|nr:helix-turn-helix domain-containing protein [Chryseobacterium manosquense]QNS41771.1 helix-turn-helix domain-containing protein [Chryseobacterium manosquense]
MKLDFYKPKNEILKKYIEGYYFISEDQHQKTIKYWTFPNNYCIFSVYQNTNEEFAENQFIITSSKQKNIIAGLVSRYSKPIEIVYENPVNEITIYFKPLGINQFIENPNVFKQSQISNYIPFSDYKEKMENIFNTKNREHQIEQLEDYWLSKFIKKDLTLIEQILSDVEADLKIEEIAEKYNFTRQYINKIFSKNIGKTPSEYRKIFRFRKALNEVKKATNLTHLSHNNLFYDQAHFIKDFKALTNTNPTSFFKNVDTEKGNVWLFV